MQDGDLQGVQTVEFGETCPKCGKPIASGIWNTHVPYCKGNGRDPLLVEREKTHGSFKNTAYAAQEIKNAIGKWDVNGLKPEFKEPLDMIATKIARILSGNAKVKDHWDDIAGYAKLGAEACNE